jgi:oxygen-dependent protoporphyrinogen oxidase
MTKRPFLGTSDRAEDHNPAADVVVIGGGLSGLAAARAARQSGLGVQVLERSERIGGRVRTENVGGVYIEVGAAFISKFYDATIALIDELGLSPELVRRSQRAYLVDHRTEQGLWPGSHLMSGDALPATSKARLLLLAIPLLWHWRQLDIADLPRGAGMDSRSAAQYLGRLTGQKCLDNFFAPLFRGLLWWDADSTGAAIALAILKAFATRSGTYRLNDGMDQLSKTLSAGIDTRTNSIVRSVTPTGDGYLVTADGPDGEHRISARAVIFATTASQVNGLVQWLPDNMARFLRSVSYTRTAVLTFRLPADAKHYPQGALLFPLPAIKDVASVNPLYTVVDAARGQDAVSADPPRLVNIFLSDQGAAEYEHNSDHELSALILKRVSGLIGDNDWTSGAELVHVQRWAEALPRFGPGHIAEVEKFRDAETELRRITFAGDYLDGPYIDGAVRSGQRAGRRIVRQLLASSTQQQ